MKKVVSGQWSVVSLAKCLVGIVCFFTFHLSPFTSNAQTDLYKLYASQPNVKVASVSNFALDSNAKVDVTVIAAEDEAGWEWMKREFFIGDLSPEQQQGLGEGNDVVLFARRSRSNPRENAPIVDESINMAASCYMGISYLSRAVYVFCADTEEEYDAVVTRLVKKIMHSNR